MAYVTSSTADGVAALHQDSQAGVGEEDLEALRDLHIYNQIHIGRLDRQLASVQSLCSLYEDRLERLRQREVAVEEQS
ncbi:hypothetical protein C8T65DRAFT_738545 [Cerioporus squamosus]|nr:hypothetical protein C8T65DRAFT_746227 [Cerioporus squamosus]KAI0715690.1 hypothetical protein C8T65DRAFT_738545 [Cerioporus squamosus]